MGSDKGKSIEAVRKEVHAFLAALTPQEARALRARFGIGSSASAPDDEEEVLRALARELAMLKKRKNKQ